MHLVRVSSERFRKQQRQAKQGFSLLELSICVVIIGIMIASILPAITQQTKQEKAAQLTDHIEMIQAALQAYAQAHYRLPCPAQAGLASSNANFGVEAATPGTCMGGTPAATSPATDVVVGTVPVRALGLEDSIAFDPWGRAYTYMVDARATGSAAFSTYDLDDAEIGNVTVRHHDAIGDTLSDITDKAIAVVLSHGENGHGGYLRSGSRYSSGSTNTHEQNNCNCDASAAAGTNDAIFVRGMNSTSQASGTTGYDDYLRFLLRKQFPSPADISDSASSEPVVVASAGGDLTEPPLGPRYALFDNVNDYIEVGNPTTFNTLSVASVSFWMKSTEDNHEVAFGFGCGGLGSGGITNRFSIGANTGVFTDVMMYYSRRRDADNGYYQAGYSTTDRNEIFDGFWHHIVVTFSGTTNGTQIYVDGEAKTMLRNGTDEGKFGVPVSPCDARIGQYSHGNIHKFGGGMQNFRVYSDVLTTDEISYLYSGGSSGTNPGSANLVLHYSLTQSSGTSITDQAGGDNTGATVAIDELTFWATE